jgi:DNA mismatch repair protein MutS
LNVARILGELDALQSLAQLHSTGWTFPVIDESLELDLKNSVHPVVDSFSRGSFVPNSVQMNPNSRATLLITGPNMGGKSTVMRQVALTVILGQMGAPVPATSARWGVFKSLYTRIGAHDAIARGQSTFMVEMSELAHILRSADDRSLILLDEIGRGTSTYDGMSVAWSTLEWITEKIGARTLFATHYHELTALSETHPSLMNVHMAVESESNRDIRFLYELRDGATSDSFGIQVAALAGIPGPVLDRSWEILRRLEAGSTEKKELQKDIKIQNKPPTPKSLTTDFSNSTPITDQLTLILNPEK